MAKGSIRIGISSCLLGEKVRFDGQHKKDALILTLLSPYVEWKSICPEVESGMTVPREPIRLVGRGNRVRLMTVNSGKDMTDSMLRYSTKKMAAIRKLKLSAFILKRGSPSCGMARVKCYDKNGIPATTTSGIFAKTLLEAFPYLPVEEEGRLRDSKIRENFIERIFAYHRVQQLFRGKWTLGQLVAFHTQHKFQVLAHSPKEYQMLGRLVAKGKSVSRSHLEQQYTQTFMSALKKNATIGRNVNTLEHILGFLKEHLNTVEKKEIKSVIKDYQKAWVPLVVPVTLLSHYVKKCEVTYLLDQTYLEPNPRELMLRNHV